MQQRRIAAFLPVVVSGCLSAACGSGSGGEPYAGDAGDAVTAHGTGAVPAGADDGGTRGGATIVTADGDAAVDPRLAQPDSFTPSQPAAGIDLPDGGSGPTYYNTIKPILDAKCAGCHQPGGIAPFSLTTYDDVAPVMYSVEAAVVDRVMPPWPASNACNEYTGSRALEDEQIAAIQAWVAGGGPMGRPETAFDETPPPAGLSRADYTLPMAEPYTPGLYPDDERCFVIDWPATYTRFITGFGVAPGQISEVHHVIAWLAPPSEAERVMSRDARQDGPGYTCWGDAGFGFDFPLINYSLWLGVWAPGEHGYDYPEHTGIKVEPGSKVVLQVHYNTLSTAPVPDVTAVQFSAEDEVQREALMLPWYQPDWTFTDAMYIPAGAADVMHDYALDPTLFLGGGPTMLSMAMLHMHWLGRSAKLSIVRKAGGEECVLDIPEWDFNWQLSYHLKTAMTIKPGDKLKIECHWDNTTARQMVVNGERQPPRDVWWGDGTQDEMCLGVVYLSPAR